MDGQFQIRMQADLVAALKRGDRATVGVLRTTLAALANAEAVDASAGDALVPAGLLGDVERRRLSVADAESIVIRERDELTAVALELEQVGRPAEAARCRAQAAVLDGYLAA